MPGCIQKCQVKYKNTTLCTKNTRLYRKYHLTYKNVRLYINLIIYKRKNYIQNYQVEYKDNNKKLPSSINNY